MGKVIINDTTLTSIADAIREKNGQATTYLPSEMPAAIQAIEGGGSKINITNAEYLFYENFNKNIFDVLTFDNLQYANYAFYDSNLQSLTYEDLISFFTGENIFRCTYAFSYTTLPTILGDINLPGCGYATQLFSHASGVEEIGNMYIPTLNAQSLFYQCTSIKKIGDIDISSATNITSVFNGCSNLEEIGQITFNTTDLITSYSSFMSSCNKLKSIKNINLQKINGAITSSTTFFPRGNSSKAPAALEELTFANTTYDNKTTKKDIYLTYCSLNHDAIVNLFNTAPDISDGTASTITLTGNPGTGEITGDEIAIVEAKGYTVVY